MNVAAPVTIVLLGMIGRLRVAGGVWQALHYLIGFQKLGYDVYYVEAHGSMTWAFGENEPEAAAFLNSVMSRFGFANRWAFHARSGSGQYYGMSERQVHRLYDSAAAIINLHGGTLPTAEQSATGCLVYLDTDPVAVQVEIHKALQPTLEVLERHSAFFTFGENYGNSDCRLPVSDRFHFKATRQPVVLDLWESHELPSDTFTTVGNWQQLRRFVEYDGEEYLWSKHFEFMKFLDLPTRTTQSFELALSSCDEDSRNLLKQNGWRVRDAFGFTQDLDAYWDYIRRSKGEFTVAKDQNIRLRTGWFSDRSATYLASGLPVITQETGFSNVFPTGEGLFSFSSMADILSAVAAINSDYERHRRGALTIAREYFSHEVVLTSLMSELGIGNRAHRKKPQSASICIVGCFSSGTGLGAVARRYARALELANVSVRCIDVSGSQDLTGPPVRGDAAINLICCDIDSHYAVRSRLGEDFFRGRYNIGVWLWELPTFPLEWHDRFIFYDEIWAPSSFIASALGPVSPVPVIRIPLVLEPELRGSRERGRRRLSLADEFTFAFTFNFHSRFERKNPVAVIDSFKAAFGPDETARLVIKCANADFDEEHFGELNRLAAGHRISILAGEWPAEEMMDLVEASDCHVSLHRAEGVGLTISDAMAAGKPVVATGWSGNMDFMNVNNSFPVRYQLVELDRNVAHYRKGDRWAEPSIQHAAEMLRYVFSQQAEAARYGEAARHEILSNFSYRAVGDLIARRIDLISKRDQFNSLKQRLQAPVADLDAFLAEFADLGAYMPRDELRYAELKTKLREVVSARVPPAATLIVVSKGDDELLGLDGCRAIHFPQDPTGKYAGYYPRDSAEAIRQLESVRRKEGSFLLFPSTAFWWLEHYSEFRDHLVDNYKVAHGDESCLMFEL